MIDLHCDILPGIDDGALDLADSAAMAAQGGAVVEAREEVQIAGEVRRVVGGEGA